MSVFAFIESQCQAFIFPGETGHQALFSWSFDIFQIFPDLLNLKLFQELVKQFVDKLSSTRCQVPFFLW